MRIAFPVVNNYPLPLPDGIHRSPQALHLEVLKILAVRGHQVTIFCSADSTVDVPFQKISPGLDSVHALKIQNPEADYDLQFWLGAEHLVLSAMYEQANRGDFDIIWDGYPFWAAPYLRFSKVPTLFTLHDPPSVLYKLLPFYVNYKASYVAISNSQAQSLPEIPIKQVIYNGVDLSQVPFVAEPDDYFVFFGRLVPDKGVLESIRVALNAGVSLKIIGRFSTASHLAAYRIEVEALIDGTQISYLGPLSQAELWPIVAHAKGFINLVNVAESFGMALIESMAAGTPVIARSVGAIPEIISNGTTGFVVHSEQEAVEAIMNIGSIDRTYCRQYVQEHFSLEQTANQYEQLMQELLA